MIDRTLGVNGDEKGEAALAELELLLDERIRSAEKGATSKRTVGAIFKDACSKSETR